MQRLRILIPALALLAAGCSSGTTVATDPSPTTASPSASATPEPTSSPTAEPDAYPSFGPTDYTYVVSVGCFCVDGGVPIRITVREGAAVKGVYLGDGRGVAQGSAADTSRLITINDIIDRINQAVESGAAEVDVEWPDGQDHPDRVFIDQDERMADEEIGYTISEVVLD